MARPNHEAHDLAKTADHRTPAQLRSELGNGIDPVLQREYSRLRSDQTFYRARGGRHLPGFDAQNNQIDRADFGHVIGSFSRINQETAVETVDLQTISLDRPQMLATRNERHVFAGLGKSATEVSAHATCAKDSNSHLKLLA